MIYWRNIPRDARVVEHPHVFEVKIDNGTPEPTTLTAYWMASEERDAVRVMRARARQIAGAS